MGRMIDLQVMGTASIDRFGLNRLKIKSTESGSGEFFEMVNGGRSLKLDDSQFQLVESGAPISFTVASLDGSGQLTVKHRLRSRYVPGIYCSVWPKSIIFQSEEILKLDFAGIDLAGTQELWFPGCEGAEIL